MTYGQLVDAEFVGDLFLATHQIASRVNGAVQIMLELDNVCAATGFKAKLKWHDSVEDYVV